MIIIAAVDDEQQPLAFGGHPRQLWQWRWQPSTATLAVIVDVDDRTMGGGWQIWMADNAAGEEQQTTQQPTIDRSVGGAVTLGRLQQWW